MKLNLEEDLRCKLVLYDAGLINSDQVAEAAYQLILAETSPLHAGLVAEAAEVLQ